MRWIRLPIILAKVADLEEEDITGIPAKEDEGQMYISEEEISHLLGADEMTTIFIKGQEEPYVINLPIGDVIRLIDADIRI